VPICIINKLTDTPTETVKNALILAAQGGKV